MRAEYLEAFVRESEENITEINAALLDLESNPDDTDAMNAVFRTAHTLKGNFAAMGIDEPSRLAHVMEDLLDEIRSGEMQLTAEIMDVVFDGVDQIEMALTNLENDGTVSINPHETIVDIETLLERNESEVGASTDSTVSRERAVTSFDISTVDDSTLLVTVDVETGPIPSVDLLFVLDAIEESLTPVDTVPDRFAIDAGTATGPIYVVCEDDAGTVESTLESLSAVRSFEIEVFDTSGSGSSNGPASLEAAGDTSDQPGLGQMRSIRVDTDRIDALFEMVEGLVTNRLTLRRAIDDGDIDIASRSLDDLDKLVRELQDEVMDMRLIPADQAVNRLPRLVRDLSRDEGKSVDFEMTGTEIELDRTILNEITDPLVHIIRNAVDHGIEPPEERERADKPRTGRLDLQIDRRRDHVVIEISDDGRGLDADVIQTKAIERGLVTQTEVETMCDEAVFDLIFEPGFSTRDEVTDVSGRGVGMNVVREAIDRLDGSISVSSDPGAGTSIALRVPVTMAIVQVLFFRVGTRTFGIPITHVDEIMTRSHERTVQGRSIVEKDDDLYPILDLAESFDINTEIPESMLIRIRPTERRIALRCSAVTTQAEVVVKPMEGPLVGTSGLSGMCVLGEGNIVPILDIDTLEVV